jgi:hypothetical protein
MTTNYNTEIRELTPDVADILPRNASMLRLIARATGIVTTSRDEDAVHVTVLFPASAEVSAVRSPAASASSLCGVAA